MKKNVIENSYDIRLNETKQCTLQYKMLAMDLLKIVGKHVIFNILVTVIKIFKVFMIANAFHKYMYIN